ncbi:MAG: acetylxylan esterase [Alphaproteobacteria bacterium]|nr:acetylxylan esterase [Alphaproteobacteria bacterium]
MMMMMAGVSLASVPAFADEQVFVFTYTTDLLPKDKYGVEQWGTWRGQKAHGSFNLLEGRSEYSYPLDPSWITGRATQGWLAIDVDSHDERPDQATAPQNYSQLGDTSRETSYFLDMYLRDTRALDWARTLPQWDKTTMVLYGGSMGGQQSLVTAGLNPGKVTAVFVNEPAGADSAASLHGRKPSYPDWQMSNPLVAKTAPYFDAANFTPNLTAPTMAAVGLIDSVCPPTSIFSEVNEIPAPHEIVPMPESEHMMYTPDKQGAYIQRSKAALTTLLHGGIYVPDETVSKDR